MIETNKTKGNLTISYVFYYLLLQVYHHYRHQYGYFYHLVTLLTIFILQRVHSLQ